MVFNNDNLYLSLLLSTGEKSVRLIDGENMHSGRVEIFFNGEWGTVCDDTFGKEEGQVICNQLGYPGDVQVYGNAEFGKGRGPIMDEINCFYPSGRDWMNCQIGEWDTTVCTHSEDVGLICLDACEYHSVLAAFYKTTCVKRILPTQ